MATQKNRRDFFRKIAIGGIVIAGSSKGFSTSEVLKTDRHNGLKSQYSANDQIRLGIIGCGIQGFSNAHAAVQVPGIEVVAVCDLYTGRLARMKEVYGDHIKTTQSYEELLAMPDVDAVCIATSD